MRPDLVMEPAEATVPAPPPTPPPPLRWVPVRPLAPRHRPRILAHLLALDAHDRHLRFGHAATDGQIGRYVDLLDFDRDEVFGVFNRRLELVAMAHLAMLPQREGPASAEFGVSVWRRVRGRGIGERLFERAALHARNRGIGRLVIHALMENRAMLHIVRKAGASIDPSGGEAQAHLTLPPDDVASHLEAAVATQAAEIDYRAKQQAHGLDGMLDTWSRLIAPPPTPPVGPPPSE